MCGRATLEIAGDITDASLCHCSICRKVTGSAYGAYGGVPSRNFKWVQGKECLTEYNLTDNLKKYFCQFCDSTLVTRHSSWPDYTYISLGCLDEDPQITLEYHQFVGSRASWDAICDGVKQYEEWPDAEI